MNKIYHLNHFYFIRPHHVAYGILLPQLGTEQAHGSENFRNPATRSPGNSSVAFLCVYDVVQLSPQPRFHHFHCPKKKTPSPSSSPTPPLPHRPWQPLICILSWCNLDVSTVCLSANQLMDIGLSPPFGNILAVEFLFEHPFSVLLKLYTLEWNLWVI